MKQHDAPPPADVVRAVEQLESALSPVGIGQAYATAENWRRSQPGPSLLRTAWELLSVVVIFILLVMINSLSLDDFASGVLFGVLVTIVVGRIASWAKRRPATFTERADRVIDRWRHLVPAMTDGPRV